MPGSSAFHATLKSYRLNWVPNQEEELVETEQATVIGDSIAKAAVNMIIISVVILGTLIARRVGKFQQVSDYHSGTHQHFRTSREKTRRAAPARHTAPAHVSSHK